MKYILRRSKHRSRDFLVSTLRSPALVPRAGIISRLYLLIKVLKEPSCMPMANRKANCGPEPESVQSRSGPGFFRVNYRVGRRAGVRGKFLPSFLTLTDFCLIDCASDPGCPHGRRNKSKRHHRTVTSPHTAVICKPSCDDSAHGRSDPGDQAC